MRTTNVDQVLPYISGMFLWLSNTKRMTFGRSKTVWNIIIHCLLASDEINSFYECQSCFFGKHVSSVLVLLVNIELTSTLF